MKEIYSIFGMFILSVLVYLQVPYIETISLIALWVMYGVVTFVFFITLFIWEEFVNNLRSGRVKWSHEIAKTLMIGAGAYLLHLSGQYALVTLIISIMLFSFIAIVCALKGIK